MSSRSSILCPVDFSEPSRGALRHAAALAAHFDAQLVVLTVNDPLLVEAAAVAYDLDRLIADVNRDLERFVEEALPGDEFARLHRRLLVEAGDPSRQILTVARELPADAIVMSTGGRTGLRRMFFASTTERVLRETATPVLVTPAAAPGPASLEDACRSVRRVLAPLDLQAASARQVAVAAAAARAMRVPLLLAHIVEPLRVPARWHAHLPSVDAERRARAEEELQRLAAAQPDLEVETLVVYGDAAEEIAKLARSRNAGLIVVGLHGSPRLGPRMGAVTYRVLCLAPVPVLALPPAAEG